MNLTITTPPLEGGTLPEQLGITKERAREMFKAMDNIIDSYYDDPRNDDPTQSNKLVAESMRRVSATIRTPEELMYIGQVMGTQMGTYDSEDSGDNHL